MDVKHRELHAPLPVGIDTSPPCRRLLFRQNPFSLIVALTHPRRQRGEERRAAGRQVDLPAGRKDDIPDDLPFEAPHRVAPQEHVFGIFLNVPGVVKHRAHPVRFRIHDQAVDLLDAPSLAYEFRRQPVQQLRMRGRDAHLSKTAWRGYNAAAEVPVPQAVHEDTSGQRVLRGGDPLGQGPPAAAGHIILAL